MLCLVVEYPSSEEAIAPFTRAHAGATVDLMVEPDDAARQHRSELVLVRGAPMAEIEALLQQVRKTHAPVQELRRDAVAGLWFGRLHFQAGKLGAPSAKALGKLAAHIGPPWVHVENGVVLLRARLRDTASPDATLEMAQALLAEAGFDAQCVVQEVSPRDHSVWEALVQHGIGLTL
jgi:hypothetical protein